MPVTYRHYPRVTTAQGRNAKSACANFAAISLIPAAKQYTFAGFFSNGVLAVGDITISRDGMPPSRQRHIFGIAGLPARLPRSSNDGVSTGVKQAQT